MKLPSSTLRIIGQAIQYYFNGESQQAEATQDKERPHTAEGTPCTEHITWSKESHKRSRDEVFAYNYCNSDCHITM